MGRISRLVMALLLFWIWGCTSPPPRRETVSYLDLTAKQTYLRHTLATLKAFHRTACDLRTRPVSEAMKELHQETSRFIERQVRPATTDFEANYSGRTQLDVAQLELLCGLLYLELQDYPAALSALESMRTRYGDRPELLNAALDQRFIDFDNLAAGLAYLDNRLAQEYPVQPPHPTPKSRRLAHGNQYFQ